MRLAQPAEVIVRVKRGKRTVRTILHDCVRGSVTARWTGASGGAGSCAERRAGRYRLRVLVRSDRKPVARSRAVRLTRP